MSIVYIRLKKKISAQLNETITLRNIAYVSSVVPEITELEQTTIYTVRDKDHNVIVLDSFIIINHLNKLYPNLEFQILGPTETMIKVNEATKKTSLIYVGLVWVLLFIGTAMTIMNFHYDVSMQEVQQKLHYLFTGKEEKFPLWIQIPYSFGLGIGMVIFLNHWFKKRINEEPSPLEVELYNYQLNLDDYLKHYENELNDEYNDKIN